MSLSLSLISPEMARKDVISLSLSLSLCWDCYTVTAEEMRMVTLCSVCETALGRCIHMGGGGQAQGSLTCMHILGVLAWKCWCLYCTTGGTQLQDNSKPSTVFYSSRHSICVRPS